jgi:hypothetical protein
MKTLTRFLRTTILGGVFFLISNARICEQGHSYFGCFGTQPDGGSGDVRCHRRVRLPGLRDYHDRNGRVSGYTVTTLENGDKIYKELSGTTETTVAPDGSTKTTTETVATWTGGTGHYQTVRGIERGHTAVDWAKGESKPTSIHGSADGEYWFEK